MAGRKYRVLNPRNIAHGRYIVRHVDKAGVEILRLFEGDVFEPPAGFDIKRCLRDGFIEPAAGAVVGGAVGDREPDTAAPLDAPDGDGEEAVDG